ncbi:MAG: PIG-L deacetylase family protein [Actinomycetota bacterium]|nr:PIG-L deacetylase family protein [Actinomycetota bacterium]
MDPDPFLHNRDGSRIDRLLAVMAHPDDVDFGAAGSIRAWVEAGVEVSYCLITNGDAGGFDPDVPRSKIPEIRQAEQRAAGAVLGVADVRFLGYRDGELAVSHELRRDISRVIRQVRPDRMLIQSPERNWGRIQASHPDHLAAGEAAIQAIYPDARNPFAHVSLLADEGLEAWTVPEVWIMASPAPDFFVDITEQFPHKVAALRAHASQTAHMDDLEDRIRGWMTMWAQQGGLPEGQLAEAFKVVGTA